MSCLLDVKSTMPNFIAPIPLSLYIHLPWCIRKCPYCDFNSHKAKSTLPEKAYVERLLQELDEKLPLIWGRRLVSIFFGGGTPSLFSANAIENILLGVYARLPFSQNLEITLEANPGTLDESRFKNFRSVGVNRLSIGIQSLQNEKLKILGRIHDRDYALRAIETTYTAGFENFNLDLMHGLPAQTLQDGIEDLQDALAFNPPHVSWYQLTLEPNTLFAHCPPDLPQEETLWDIQEHGKNLLQAAHFNQYEVSAYAKPYYECQHNTNYWEFGDYLGIGAGAHSKITDVSKQQIVRCANTKNPKDYLDKTKAIISSQKILTQKDIIFEFMLNALRLTKGIATTLFEERTGLSQQVLQKTITNAQQKGLLQGNANRICPTELGSRFLNDLVGMFL